MSDAQGPDKLSRAEIGKDAVQTGAEAAASAVGEVATIITAAVRDVATALGGFATELFEIRDAARKASEEHLATGAPAGTGDLETGDLGAGDLEAGEPDKPEGPAIS